MGPLVVLTLPPPASDAHHAVALEGLDQPFPIVLDACLVVGPLVPAVHSVDRGSCPIGHRGYPYGVRGQLEVGVVGDGLAARGAQFLVEPYLLGQQAGPSGSA